MKDYLYAQQGLATAALAAQTPQSTSDKYLYTLKGIAQNHDDRIAILETMIGQLFRVTGAALPEVGPSRMLDFGDSN